MLDTAAIDCPYCGEPFETSIDCSAGGQQYIEDCPVCCQPIEMKTDVDAVGNLRGISALRNDD
ncbi:MAG: CPXCG motif-containing cysteine-rich protein [Gammaproteobacteria bacterium]|nr:MAG: CPXCG motif-containing cysteine-rich protein [Gammaproteobacteria bacterium]